MHRLDVGRPHLDDDNEGMMRCGPISIRVGKNHQLSFFELCVFLDKMTEKNILSSAGQRYDI